MVNEKMCCGTHIDKQTGSDLLLCRIGPDAYETMIGEADCIPMTFTGRPMKGYVYVLAGGIKSDAGLSRWLQLCLDFNPAAKKSRK